MTKNDLDDELTDTSSLPVCTMMPIPSGLWLGYVKGLANASAFTGMVRNWAYRLSRPKCGVDYGS